MAPPPGDNGIEQQTPVQGGEGVPEPTAIPTETPTPGPTNTVCAHQYTPASITNRQAHRRAIAHSNPSGFTNTY